MSYSVFLNFCGVLDASETPEGAGGGRLFGLLSDAADLNFLATYVPAGGEVAMFRDGPGASFIVEINLDRKVNLEQLLQSGAFKFLLNLAGPHPAPTVDVFETVSYPLADGVVPERRVAPLSFVVRYYRPVDDASAFSEFYARNHPPLLAQFPGVRNVLCYLPVDVGLPNGMKDSGAFLGNEVVFDDLASLNAALASDVLAALKADSRRFACFGHNTHHAMMRKDFYD